MDKLKLNEVLMKDWLEYQEKYEEYHKIIENCLEILKSRKLTIQEELKRDEANRQVLFYIGAKTAIIKTMIKISDM